MPDWTRIAGIRPHEITDRATFERRRELLRRAGAVGALAGGIGAGLGLGGRAAAAPLEGPIAESELSVDDELTSFETASTYNNFYELGTDKKDPARNADLLVTEPWSVAVDGACERPGTYTLEDVLGPHPLEERIYRLRCVEAWSMVIPWNGFALADLLKRFEPTSAAKYVAFETVVQEDLPGIRRGVLDFPYREGLRIDEAMHPLAFMAVGMYGETLPNQNGAPLRLVVPWKYGFKSIKSIVRISFVEEQPPTSWNALAPREYGFYSNVNPEVSHPRWSQARERRLAGDAGGLTALFTPKIDTLPFNGYAEAVAGLYSGMDLAKHY